MREQLAQLAMPAGEVQVQWRSARCRVYPVRRLARASSIQHRTQLWANCENRRCSIISKPSKTNCASPLYIYLAANRPIFFLTHTFHHIVCSFSGLMRHASHLHEHNKTYSPVIRTGFESTACHIPASRKQYAHPTHRQPSVKGLVRFSICHWV